MQLSPAVTDRLAGSFKILKAPEVSGPPAQRDPQVIATVSEMLSTIQRRGLDAVKDYAQRLDPATDGVLELDATTIDEVTERISSELKRALDLGAARTAAFAREARSHLVDFETELVPGLVTGVRYIPVQRVGGYLPAGQFPILASAFMTVNVAKVAGTQTVLTCTPPQRDGRPDPAVLYSAKISGADHVFLLGGVQAIRRWTCWWAPATPTSPRPSDSCSAPWRSTCWRARRRSR
jgi:sulfopropanediol 3-dehydrogenase